MRRQSRWEDRARNLQHMAGIEGVSIVEMTAAEVAELKKKT